MSNYNPKKKNFYSMSVKRVFVASFVLNEDIETKNAISIKH